MALFKKFLHLFLIRENKHVVYVEEKPIFKAIQAHQFDEVKHLLKENSALIFEKDSSQENLLFYAIRQRAGEVVRYLDTKNFSLANHTDELSNNALHLVCMQNDEASAYHFIQRHPELIYQKNKRGEYADDLTTSYQLYQKLYKMRIHPPIQSKDTLKDSYLSLGHTLKHVEHNVIKQIHNLSNKKKIN